MCAPGCLITSDSLWPPWTIDRQVPLSMEFSRQEYWSRLPLPFQGIFPTQGWNSCLLSPALADGFFTTEPSGKPRFSTNPYHWWKKKKKCESVSHPGRSIFCISMTVASQSLLSMGFSRQKYWGGQPFPSPGDFPNPGIKPVSLALQVDSLLCEPPGKPLTADSPHLQVSELTD